MDRSIHRIDQVFLDQRESLIGSVTGLVRCRDTAEDVVQEAYVRACSIAASKPVQSPQRFLFRVARNLALDHLRWRRRQAMRFQPAGDEAERVPSPNPDPAATVDGIVQLRRLQTVIEALPARRREILLLHKVHGWRLTDVAAHMGLSLSAVEKNLRRALQDCLIGFAEP